MKGARVIRSVVIYTGAHPAHQQMLGERCSASIKMLGEWAPGKQVSILSKLRAYLATAIKVRKDTSELVIIEGTTATTIIAPIIKCCNRRQKTVIALCADDALYRSFIENRRLRGIFTRWSFRFVDKIIAIGNLVTKLAKTYLPPLPIETLYPPLPQDKIRSLSALKPALDAHNLLLIGTGSTHVKGVDIAIDCLKILRSTFPDARLIILGFHDIKEQPGVTSPGPVADIKPYLAKASILIHPVRGDAFPLVVPEAMLAGVVPIVSEWTGAASIVQKVSPSLVVPLKAEKFAAMIAAFWEAPQEYREQMSAEYKQVAQAFCKQAAKQPSLAPFIENI